MSDARIYFIASERSNAVKIGLSLLFAAARWLGAPQEQQ